MCGIGSERKVGSGEDVGEFAAPEAGVDAGYGSGGRCSALVFCISPFTKLYLPAVEHYRPDRVYILVGTGGDAVSKVARMRFDEVRSGGMLGSAECISVDASDYQGILSKLVGISDKMKAEFGDGYEVFINTSSGTHEYAAAAMFASEHDRHFVPFRTVCRGMSEDDLLALATEADEKTSSAELVRHRPPSGTRPNRDLLVFLGVMEGMLAESRYVDYGKIVEALKNTDGGWSYDQAREDKESRLSTDEKRRAYLKKHYVDVAIKNGWVLKPSKNTMEITELGRSILDTYCRDRPVAGAGVLQQHIPNPCTGVKGGMKGGSETASPVVPVSPTLVELDAVCREDLWRDNELAPLAASLLKRCLTAAMAGGRPRGVGGGGNGMPMSAGSGSVRIDPEGPDSPSLPVCIPASWLNSVEGDFKVTEDDFEHLQSSLGRFISSVLSGARNGEQSRDFLLLGLVSLLLAAMGNVSGTGPTERKV